MQIEIEAVRKNEVWLELDVPLFGNTKKDTGTPFYL